MRKFKITIIGKLSSNCKEDLIADIGDLITDSFTKHNQNCSKNNKIKDVKFSGESFEICENK